MVTGGVVLLLLVLLVVLPLPLVVAACAAANAWLVAVATAAGPMGSLDGGLIPLKSLFEKLVSRCKLN